MNKGSDIDDLCMFDTFKKSTDDSESYNHNKSAKFKRAHSKH
jgi:hypothetical protein